MSGLRGWTIDATDNIFQLMVINVLWLGFTLLIVTAPPALAGLFYATNKLAHGRYTGWRTFFVGFRSFFNVSWCWFLLNAIILIVPAIFLSYVDLRNTNSMVWISGGLLAILFVWSIAQIYIFPLIIEQSQPRLHYALWNSFILMLRRPVRWFATGVLVLAIIIFSTILFLPGWLVITASLLGYLINRSTIHLIHPFLTQESSV